MSNNQHCPHCGCPFVDAKTQYKLVRALFWQRAVKIFAFVVVCAALGFSMAMILGGTL